MSRRGPEPVRAFLLLFVLAMGVALYGAFLPGARGRWTWAMHDRGVHALAAIKLATAVRGGDFATFFSELLKPKLYPPLQALLGALAGIVAGPHYRIVLLPSLIGWMGMMVLGCALAYRVARPGTKLAAGFVAGAWMAASPADRFYATDTMLESLGAGLTVAVLYAYTLARERPDAKRVRWLALALTLLFFEKYNYWLLAVIGLCADLVLDAAVRRWAVRNVRERAGAVILHVATQPLLWVALALAAATAVVAHHGPTKIGGVSLYPPRGLLTAAVWMGAAQIGLEFARLGRARWRALPAGARMMWWWHGLPLLVWLMLPGRLWTILFFVGTGNAGDARYSGLAGLRYYAECLADQYATGWWGLAPAAGLAAVGAVIVVGWRRTARGVVTLLAVGAVLAALHPNKQGRYLHSWIPALWILSGIGAAGVIEAIERRSRAAGVAAAVLGCALLAAGLGRSIVREPSGHDEMAQYHPKGTLLEATDTYLPYLAPYRRVAIFAPSGWPVAEWTFLEKFGDDRKLDLVRWGGDVTPVEARQLTRAWAAATGDDAALVITAIDPEKPSLWTRDGYEHTGVTSAAAAALQSPGSGFEAAEVWRFSLSNTAATLFVRSGPATQR